MDLIERWILQMQQIFGKDDFYFEMQPSKNKDQIYVNHKLVELGAKYGIKYIITNDAHYQKKEDRIILLNGNIFITLPMKKTNH